jgi:hypothetical protein
VFDTALTEVSQFPFILKAFALPNPDFALEICDLLNARAEVFLRAPKKFGRVKLMDERNGAMQRRRSLRGSGHSRRSSSVAPLGRFPSLSSVSFTPAAKVLSESTSNSTLNSPREY